MIRRTTNAPLYYLLATRHGIRHGGASQRDGVIPGNVEGSRLIEAIRYRNEELQMPPDARLPDSVIADFEKWVAMRAPDPRDGVLRLPREIAERHWAWKRENTYLLKKRLEQHGHTLDVISVAEGTVKSNGHHFDHPEPQRVVDFITRHASVVGESSRLDLLRRSRRIVFLGDSITYAGHYVAYFDAWLSTQKLDKPPVVIEVGLPSETVSGLSEDGHAGGKFPRPDLAERLDRVLTITKPDLVFACYGINCGIYQPFDPARFQRYQTGIRHLKKKVEANGATLVLITPPSYDDQRAKKAFSANENPSGRVSCGGGAQAAGNQEGLTCCGS